MSPCVDRESTQYIYIYIVSWMTLRLAHRLNFSCSLSQFRFLRDAGSACGSTDGTIRSKSFDNSISHKEHGTLL